MQQDVGSIEAGKFADLAILDGNPLDNIRNTNTVRYVMKNGELYDADTLNTHLAGGEDAAEAVLVGHGAAEAVADSPLPAEAAVVGSPRSPGVERNRPASDQTEQPVHEFV